MPTFDAAVFGFEVATQIPGTWIVHEKVSDVDLTRWLTGTDGIQVKQDILRTTNRTVARHQAASGAHASVPARRVSVEL